MNRQELKSKLDESNIDPHSYSLDGRTESERYVLEVATGGWVVFYAERGQRTGLQLLATEDEACRALLDILLRDSTTRR